MKRLSIFLGGLLFVLSALPILGVWNGFGSGISEFFLGISIFLPVVFAIAGLLFSIFGSKGTWKVVLILLNTASVIFWGFVLFVAIFGFQNP
ncbi:hypothetical protein QRD89_16700 [Halobacillus sp. ACCC02827]|uniref:hypothetical protein n=1 Tax=Halobacillus sp. ACCC02827 TaxID=3052090 RepID=UPI002570B181|nr:hypothetical protein [Halobacillus sp. ACCC02827]WJE15343.1 hypothetical protein QRD89_16700 [Halobacillus sp. ACCC02827]